MQHELKQGKRVLFSRWGLAITGLAVLGLVALTPSWASAEGGSAPLHFTSPLNPPGGQQGHGPNDELRELLDSIVDRDAILAEVLGISAEELQAARESGTKLEELVANAGLDKETVRAEIKSATEAAIEQAVTDGTITQEQADQLLNPPAPPERAGHEHGRGHGGQRPPEGSGGGNSGQPGGTIPSEPGGTIPATPTSTATSAATTSETADTTTSAASSDSGNASTSASDNTTPDAPPQRPERPERGQGDQGQGTGAGGGRRGPGR